MTAWTILIEGYQRNISTKLYWNQSSGFWREDFSSFLYRYIGKISPGPWRPRFLTNFDGLNNLGRGSPKEHFWWIILKSVGCFLTRRFLKFSGGHVFLFFFSFFFFLTNHDGWNNLGRGSPKKHFYRVILKSVRWFLTRRFFKFSI